MFSIFNCSKPLLSYVKRTNESINNKILGKQYNLIEKIIILNFSLIKEETLSKCLGSETIRARAIFFIDHFDICQMFNETKFQVSVN